MSSYLPCSNRESTGSSAEVPEQQPFVAPLLQAERGYLFQSWSAVGLVHGYHTQILLAAAQSHGEPLS